MRMIGLATVLALLAGPAWAEQDEFRFVQNVYSAYSDDGDGVMGEAALDRYWLPETAALIRRDRELAGGVRPYDPVCQCQNWRSLRLAGLSIHRFLFQVDPDRRNDMRADAIVWNGGQRVTVVLRLRRGSDGWRIADVQTRSDNPTLVEALMESNRRVEAGGPAAGKD